MPFDSRKTEIVSPGRKSTRAKVRADGRGYTQLNLVIEPALKAKLIEIANRERRSLSLTIAMLLEQVIREGADVNLL